MTRFQKLTAVICLIALVAASTSADAGVFCRKRCRPQCQQVRELCPDGTICPESPAEDPPTNPCLWNAISCPNNPVYWYGDRNHGAGTCDPCENCELSKLSEKSPPSASGFHVSPKVDKKGIKKSKPREEKDLLFGTHKIEIVPGAFKSSIHWVWYPRANDGDDKIRVQIIELTLRTKDEETGKVFENPVTLGLEVSRGNVDGADLKRKPHTGDSHAFKVDYGGKEVVIVTDSSTIIKPGS